MTVTLKNPRVATRVAAPSSKSAAHRALVAAAFADHGTEIRLGAFGEDIEATARCLAALGVGITPTNGGLAVTPISPDRVQKNALLDCGESGSTLRFLLPVCAALGADAAFLRRGRLPQRPLAPLDAELTRHGLCLENEGALLKTKGRITAGEYQIAANVSSQYVTGLLFALSLLENPSTLTLVGNVESAPYIQMTADVLAHFNAPLTVLENGRKFGISGRLSAPLCTDGEFVTEGDFSGAAFPLAMGAVGVDPVTVTGLFANSLQGDRAILDLLSRFGATVTWSAEGVTVSPAPLRGIDIDATHIPDLVPVLAVVATAAQGQTRITGAARLRHKESDRIASTTAFLRTLGGDITPTDDGLIIHGGHPLSGGVIDACGDHRIAMSAAVASLLTREAVVIPGAECVNKSYPTFFEDAVLDTQKE